MVEENILCVKINGQVISINNTKGICIPNREKTSDFSTGNSPVELNEEVYLKCKEV